MLVHLTRTVRSLSATVATKSSRRASSATKRLQVRLLEAVREHTDASIGAPPSDHAPSSKSREVFEREAEHHAWRPAESFFRVVHALAHRQVLGLSPVSGSARRAGAAAAARRAETSSSHLHSVGRPVRGDVTIKDAALPRGEDSASIIGQRHTEAVTVNVGMP